MRPYVLGISLMLMGLTNTALAQHVKIVGIGASTCTRFDEEIARNPTVERDYFAWAQGFMSAILLRAPEGKDKGLDLSPESLPLQQQASFLRIFCARNSELNYSDGVVALYRELRKLSGEK
ncbi:hypothetical protein [Rhodoplanes roseus]|nr:hypothetical protein [Rhodoplanes roseus]